MTSCSLLCLPGLQSSEHNILVIGVPNVGKSSLINSLRRLHLKKGISARCQGSGRMWAQCHLCCDCLSPQAKPLQWGASQESPRQCCPGSRYSPCAQEASRFTELVMEGCSGPLCSETLSSVPPSLVFWC